MAQAFGDPAFPVDTHIHRLAARWGLSDGQSVVADRARPEARLPRASCGTSSTCRSSTSAASTARRGTTTSTRCPICSWAATKKRKAEERRRRAAPRKINPLRPRVVLDRAASDDQASAAKGRQQDAFCGGLLSDLRRQRRRRHRAGAGAGRTRARGPRGLLRAPLPLRRFPDQPPLPPGRGQRLSPLPLPALLPQPDQQAHRAGRGPRRRGDPQPLRRAPRPGGVDGARGAARGARPRRQAGLHPPRHRHHPGGPRAAASTSSPASPSSARTC